MFFDIFAPLYYKLEKAASSKVIPSTHNLPGRRKLSDVAATSTTTTPKNTFDHSFWDACLKKHVTTTGSTTVGFVQNCNTVDYASLCNDENFAKYLQQLATAPADIDTYLEPKEQLAFWMNAYNALCVNVIIEHEREFYNKDDDDGQKEKLLKSITELSKRSADRTPVWDQKAGIISGKEITLNQIEHEQLRAKWDEPALHACIVCASASCPNLRPEAFVGPAVQEQMKDQMRLWMKNPTKGLKLSDDGRRIYLSRIFLWFGDDFGGWEGIQKWLPEYIEDETIKEKLAAGNLALRFFDYGWEINRSSSSNRLG